MSTPTPPHAPPLSAMHWIVGGAAITTPALIVGAMWAVADRGIGIAATLIGLAMVTTAIGAVAVVEERGQRRHNEVLAAIDTALETALGAANKAEWRGFAAGVRENLADDSPDGASGTVVPMPRLPNGKRRTQDG